MDISRGRPSGAEQWTAKKTEITGKLESMPKEVAYLHEEITNLETKPDYLPNIGPEARADAIAEMRHSLEEIATESERLSGQLAEMNAADLEKMDTSDREKLIDNLTAIGAVVGILVGAAVAHNIPEHGQSPILFNPEYFAATIATAGAVLGAYVTATREKLKSSIA